MGHNDLAKLKTILAAALSSRHKYIVSSAIELWNELFGVIESIEYPDEVAQALARLRSSANLLVPNFPDIADNEVSTFHHLSPELKANNNRFRQQQSPSWTRTTRNPLTPADPAAAA